MIGIHPTAGCLILIEKTSFAGVNQTVQALQSLMPMNNWHYSDTGTSSGRAALGGSMLEMLAHAQETQNMIALHLEFDEDEVVRLTRATGLSLEQLFLPYVQAAKALPGVIAAGVGFELSAPADLREQSLQEAGIAVLFARDEDHKSWSRKQTLPLVGHPR